MTSSPGKAVSRAPDRRPRLYPRYRCEFPVTVTVFSGEGHLQLDAHCRDLSEGGLGILVAAELTPGDVASLAFSLPGATDCWNIRAVLRYRRGYHYGFEFLSLSPQQSQALLKYLPQLERSDY
jgi:c-di-GMP-binding flagellar brake protein YcgR